VRVDGLSTAQPSAMFRGQEAAREDRGRAPPQQRTTQNAGQPTFMAAPLKNSDYVDLRTPVSGYVFSNYAYRANQDSEVAHHLADLQQLRTSVLSSSEQPEQLCGSLIRYGAANARRDAPLPSVTCSPSPCFLPPQGAGNHSHLIYVQLSRPSA